MDEKYFNNKGKGFIKLWQVNPKTGEKILLVDKPNLIINQGADIMAQALAGTPNSRISHIYVGYNTFSGSFTPPVIDTAYSVPFSNYGSGSYATYGFLRTPLAYTPSFLALTGYENNVVIFTGVIAGGGNAHGATFNDKNTSPNSQIFEVALVAAEDPTSMSKDRIFSRANFTPLIFDPSFNLTISWGVQFVA